MLALYLRPDEEIEVGEDAAGYFHMAISYAQQDAIRYTDPALAAIQPEERALFRYGHPGFLVTKDNVLWSEQQESAVVGAHFLPAYPLLMSLASLFSSPYLSLLLNAALAFMTAGLLALLAIWLTGDKVAGILAALFYLLHPVIIWNARCIRPEGAASFLALAGIAMLCGHVFLHKRITCKSLFLAGLSLGAAVSFHITAIYVVLPVVVQAFFLSHRSRDWMAWWGGLLAGGLILIAQLFWISDPYYILNNLLQPDRAVHIGLAASLLLGMGFLLRMAYSKWGARLPKGHFSAEIVFGCISAGLCMAFVVLSIRTRSALGNLPGLPEWTASYISMTDFKAAALFFSRLWAIVALAGLVPLCATSGLPGRMGRFLFYALAPASLTIGWTNNFMFETRRMMTFLVPLAVLSTTVLLVAGARWLTSKIPCPAKRKSMAAHAMAAMGALILLAAAVRGREHLYTTWNNKGSFKYYKELAGRIREEGDFLMAEYTQTAAPLERLAGLPLLAVSWGYRSSREFRAAEKVLARLVHDNPKQRYLLISPFSGSLIPECRLEPLFTASLHTHVLPRARLALPGPALERVRKLHIQRVLPAGNLPEVCLRQPGYERILDGGALGFAGSANLMLNRSITMQGVALLPDKALSILPDTRQIPDNTRMVALLVAMPDGARKGVVSVRLDDVPVPDAQYTLIGNYWLLCEIPLTGTGLSANLSLFSSHSAFVSDLFFFNANGEAKRGELGADTQSFALQHFDSQWTLAEAAFLLPRAPKSRTLWMLATPGRKLTDRVRLLVQSEGQTENPQSLNVLSDWHWYPLTIHPSTHPRAVWHNFSVTPGWDPELHNFPRDLGLRIHALAIPQKEH